MGALPSAVLAIARFRIAEYRASILHDGAELPTPYWVTHRAEHFLAVDAWGNAPGNLTTDRESPHPNGKPIGRVDFLAAKVRTNAPPYETAARKYPRRIGQPIGRVHFLAANFRSRAPFHIKLRRGNINNIG